MRSSLFRHIRRKPRTLFITVSVVIHALVIFSLVVIFFPKNIQKDTTTPISVTLIDRDQKQPAIATTTEPVTSIIDSQKSIQISNAETNQYSITSLTSDVRKELTATEILSTDLLIDRLEKTRQLVLDLTVDAIEKFDPIYMQAFKSDRQISAVNQDSTLATYPIGHDLTKVVFAYSGGTKLCAEFTENDPLDAFTTSVWRTWLFGCL